jgi:hypothetical protein
MQTAGQHHQPTIDINPSNPLRNARRADEGTTAHRFSSTHKLTRGGRW